jgi:hypothetical protein
LFSVWDRIETNDLTFIVHNTLMKMFPDDPPMFIQRTPMGYHDIGNIRTDLAGAGFTETTAIPGRCPAGPPPHVTRRSDSFKDRRSGPTSLRESLPGSTEP